jgi:Spy/CpxP family protein refolding chaperone
MNRSFWLKNAFKFIFFAALFVAVATFATMSLWNWLMPLIFHLPMLTFWQALGLLVLSRILTGGFGRGGQGGWARGRAWKRQMQQRMEAFSPAEREKFRQQMRNRCAGSWGRQAATDNTAESVA